MFNLYFHGFVTSYSVFNKKDYSFVHLEFHILYFPRFDMPDVISGLLCKGRCPGRDATFFLVAGCAVPIFNVHCEDQEGNVVLIIFLYIYVYS